MDGVVRHRDGDPRHAPQKCFQTRLRSGNFPGINLAAMLLRESGSVHDVIKMSMRQQQRGESDVLAAQPGGKIGGSIHSDPAGWSPEGVTIGGRKSADVTEGR